MWCDHDDSDTFYYHYKVGQKCANCHINSTTHCSYCGMKKLKDEDYMSPSIPTSYWTTRGFDEEHVENMETILLQMKKATLQLKSGERLDYGYESITLGRRQSAKDVIHEHDDILLPHWKEFVDALRMYNHEAEERSHRVLYLYNIRPDSSVMAMLTPVLQSKGYTLEIDK